VKIGKLGNVEMKPGFEQSRRIEGRKWENEKMRRKAEFNLEIL
jgi:hypothetical protein